MTFSSVKDLWTNTDTIRKERWEHFNEIWNWFAKVMWPVFSMWWKITVVTSLWAITLTSKLSNVFGHLLNRYLQYNSVESVELSLSLGSSGGLTSKVFNRLFTILCLQGNASCIWKNVQYDKFQPQSVVDKTLIQTGLICLFFILLDGRNPLLTPQKKRARYSNCSSGAAQRPAEDCCS